MQLFFSYKYAAFAETSDLSLVLSLSHTHTHANALALSHSLVRGKDVKPPRSVSRSRYFSNQTRARSQSGRLLRFVDARRFRSPLVKWCPPTPSCLYSTASSWPYKHNIDARTSGVESTVNHPLTLQNSDPGPLLRSHLKLRFIGFKEFGSGGDGPLPQAPTLSL